MMKSMGLPFLAGLVGVLLGYWAGTSTNLIPSLGDGILLLSKSENCPEGWRAFDNASGHYLMAAGGVEGLSAGAVHPGEKVEIIRSDAQLAVQPKSEPGLIVPDNNQPDTSLNVVTDIRGRSTPPAIVVTLCEHS